VISRTSAMISAMARPNRRKLVIVKRPDLGQCAGPSGPIAG
jgi:hypothetical protein